MRRRLLEGSAGPADLFAFVSEVDSSPFFEEEGEVFVARAPGRVDLMGGIGDYSGSLVLQWPIKDATLAACQATVGGAITVRSLQKERDFEIPLGELLPPSGLPLYETARSFFARQPSTLWAAYAVGAALVLAREAGARPRGFRLLVRSDVPEAQGVASSAALEVAVMRAMAPAFGLLVAPRDLALLCQKVENEIVGAACGVMDQMVASCGREGALLALLCQPAEIQGTLPLPPGLSVLGLTSGERHAVSGSGYTEVRVGAFMGMRILAELGGLKASPVEAGRVVIEDDRWGGYLANVSPREFEEEFSRRIPESMAGREFLERYDGTTDTVTRVDARRSYAVLTPTRHPIYEHDRTRRFAEILRRDIAPSSQEELGRIMRESHESYGACGLGSPGTDLLERLVREAGPRRGLLGAKITGGGSGGTVAVLARAGADLEPVAREYRQRTGHEPRVFSGSSEGASITGSIRLSRVDPS